MRFSRLSVVLVPVVAVAAAALSSSCSGCLAPTNPFDPATPADLQAPAHVVGSVVAEERAAKDGVSVVVSRGASEVQSTFTDVQGRFDVEIAPGAYIVKVSLPGFVSLIIPVELAAGTTLDLGELTLVLGSGDDPNATLIRGTATLDGQASHGGIDVRLVGWSFAAETDDAGVYQLACVPGTYQVRFQKAGFITPALVDVEIGPGEEVELPPVTLLANPATISGHVDGELLDLDGGAPVFDALQDATVALEGTSVSGVTNAAGDFTLGGVAPGSYLLRITKDGFVGESVAVLDVAGGATVTLADPVALLRERGRVHGLVALADTSDASGVIVDVTGIPGLARVTGAAGAFTFDLPAGTYELVARRDGYVTQVIGTFTIDGNADDVDAGTTTLAQAGGALSIAEGAATSSRDIGLLLQTQNVVGYHASEDPSFSDPALGDVAADPFRGFIVGDPEPFTLSDVDGTHTVFVVFFDGTQSSPPASAQIVLDREAPQAVSLAANGVDVDGGFVRAPAGVVGLTLSAFDLPPGATPGATVSGLTQMGLAHAADFSDEVVTAFSRTPTFVLDNGAVDGAKQIHARFYDGAGNVSLPLSLTVVQDNVAPANAALTLDSGDPARPDLTRSPLVTALLAATDANAGAGGENLLVRVSSSPGFGGAVFQSFSPELVVLLAPTDGDKTIFAQFRDLAGNESAVVFDDITLDQTPPSAPTVSLTETDARPDNGVTNNLALTLALSAAGAPDFAIVSESPALVGGTVVDMLGLPQPVTAPFSLAAGPGGARTVFVRFFDEAGNESDLAAATVTLDQTPPASVAPVVASAFVTSTTLSLAMPDAGQDEVQVVGDRTSPAGFVAGAAGANVNVALTDSDGTKTLTLTYRDAADNTTTLAPLVVKLDRAPPVAAVFPIQGTPNTTVTSTPNVVLDFSGVTDAVSGVSDMRISTQANLGNSVFEPFSVSVPFTLPAGDGGKTVFARFRDRAGLESATVQGTITLNATPPTGTSVVIDGGAAFSTDAVVDLTLAAVGAAQMAISQDNFASGTTFEPFATSKQVTLSGADGQKTISVKFRNSAQLEGASAIDTITLDRAAPGAGTVAIVGTLGDGASSNARTSTAAVVVQLTRPTTDTADVALAQAAGAQCAASDFAAPSFQPFAPSLTFVLTGADGSKRVCALFRDAAGNFNTASLATATTTLDTTAPTSPAFSPQPPAFTKERLQSFTVTTSTDNLAGTVTFQCRGGVFGNDFIDCGANTTIPFVLSDNAVNVVSVRARDANFNVSDAAIATVTHDDIPPVPPALRALAATDSTLSLQWSESASADVASYSLSYGFAPTDELGTGANEGDSPLDVGLANAAVLSGLTEGTAYYVRVAAVDAAGNVGQPSGELVGVPQRVSPRLVTSVGAEIHQVGALNDRIYLAQKQSVLQLNSADDVVGRAALPGVVPDDNARMIARRCNGNGGGVANGDCLFIPGYALEGDFRFAEDNFRAGISVVFFPDGGTATDPERGRVLTTIAFPARHIVIDDVAQVLIGVAEEQFAGIASFDISDPTEPLFLTRKGHPVALKEVRGAGIAFGGLYVVAAPDAGLTTPVPELYEWDLDALVTGDAVAAPIQHGAPQNLVGAVFNDPDAGGVAPNFVGGGFQLHQGGSNTTVFRYDPNGANWPLPDQALALAGCRRTKQRGDVDASAVRGTNRFFVFCAAGSTTMQVAALDVGPAPTFALTLGGSVLGQGGAQSSMANAAVTTTGTLRIAAVRQLPSSNSVTGVQRLDSWNAGTLAVVRSKEVEAGALHLAASDDLIVTTNHTGTLRVYDVKNPLLPVLSGSFTSPSATRIYTRVIMQGNVVAAAFADSPTSGIDLFTVGYAGTINLEATNVSNGGVAYADLAFVGRKLIAARAASAGVDTFNVSIGGSGAGVTVSAALSVACAAAVPFNVRALAARHDTAYLADVNGNFRIINYRTCTSPMAATLNPPASVEFPLGVEALSVAGTRVVVSDQSRSHVISVSNPAAPFYDATAMPVAGPVAQAGGFAIGAGPEVGGVPDSGPRYVVGGTALVEGAFPFVHCGDNTSLGANARAGVAALKGSIVSSCDRSGILVTSALNPNGGTLLKDVIGSYDFGAAALAVDGNFAYIGAREESGSNERVWFVDEQSLAAGTLTAEPTLNTTTTEVPERLTFVEGSVFTVEVRIFATQSVTLQQFDASDPNTAWIPVGAAATLASGTQIGGQPATNGRFLHVPLVSSVRTFDIGERSATPTIVEDYIGLGGGGSSVQRDVALYRDRLYFHNITANTIEVFDVANGAVPVALTDVPMVTTTAVSNGGLRGLAVGSGLLFSIIENGDGDNFIDVYRLGKNGDGTNGFSFIGTLRFPFDLGRAIVAGDLLYVRANLGILVFDLTRTLALGEVPELSGAMHLNDGNVLANTAFEISGPFAYLVADRYRVFDLR